MSVDQLNHLLLDIKKRKNQLVADIEREVQYLKQHNVDVDIDMKQLKYSSVNVNTANYIQLRDQLAELDFLDTISPLLKDIPVSNGSSYFKKIDINIGIIADEFLFNSFKDVANFHYVSKNNYHDLKGKIDVLLVATAWKGIDGSWKGMGNPNIGKMRKAIFDTINFFKNDGVKVVFYSKEDPTNYNYFVDIAQRCDYIFTTAAEKVEDYKRDCNNKNVSVLEFGVNPIYNNPIGIKANSELEGALFAGSWYKKYPHRQKDSRILFDGVIHADKQLKIIDRNFSLNLERHFYPTEYLSYISPSIDHESLQALLKLYQWIVNLNSVKFSQSMFANRVYEIQAMGSLLLSNYSLGINNLFPNIFIAFDSEEIKYIMQSSTEKELYKHRLFGVRQVLRNHTTFHRINHLLKEIGYTEEFIPKKRVMVIVEEETENIKQMFDQQSYENRVLVTVEEALSNTESFDYAAFFNDTSSYGEYYLEDMINAFKYTDVDFVTKDSYYDREEKIEGIEHNYIQRMDSKYRTIFSLEKYTLEALLTTIEKLSMKNGYSSDSLEYNITEEPPYITAADKKFTVIVPTFNNGQHLYGKCFMSLRRSSMFNEMEIIIVDDGSTDFETTLIIDRLAKSYENIKVYKYNDGGSGSASRPRNKGVELATTEYITFLDPDNEAVNDGFTKLYQVLRNENFDLVVGNMKKVDTGEYDFNYYRDIVYYQAKTEFREIDTREFLDSTYFKAQSIQALMVKKDVIINNKLEMVLGAVGQDTLYFHELLVHSKNFKVIDEFIHIYYAGVQGSAVNNITKKTFEKYLSMERARMKFLKENELLGTYMDKRFNYYFVNWYFKKLNMVSTDDYQQASQILYEIYEMYKKSTTKVKIDVEIITKMDEIKRSHFCNK